MREFFLKLKLPFLIFLTISFLAVMVVILVKDSNEDKFVSLLGQNNLVMQGIKIVYVIDNKTFINLYATDANADLNVNYIAMRNVKLEYDGEKMDLVATADNGVYELDRVMTATGNVQGTMDNSSFVTGADGKLIYDYKLAKGDLKNGVTVYNDNSSLYSDSVEFDVNANYISFDDNVSIIYYINSNEGANVNF